ncbi:hypothetical protein CDAR_404511 [Caerostris darwini]|uniref:Homing endonuclease LAGLIDADG domain-containing protein n=1 Tax=Caerostris darwini TaxID=1538125 RepID=A0AAV4SRI7_9ARAC|nr:hypothetical protein CDAR_404511 [Caerostris darwini]
MKELASLQNAPLGLVFGKGDGVSLCIQNSKKTDALEILAFILHPIAFIPFMEPKYRRIFHRTLDTSWIKNAKSLDNMKRVWLGSQKLNFINPNVIQWEKVYKILSISRPTFGKLRHAYGI